MGAFTGIRARTTTTTGYTRGFSTHARLPFERASTSGRIGPTSNKPAGWKINFSGVAVFLQYLMSLLAGKQPAPPPEAPGKPRLVLLANNSFDARCLDGSPPGYYFRAGTGAGKSMWHIYLPHGGWCRNANECVGRSKTALGSSTFYPDDPTNATIPSPGFNGILSSNSSINPPFYNWNLVRLIYCDGGGYSGTAGRLEINNDTAINLDGWNIVQAVIEDLKSKRRIKSASQILLSGSSAGGQAVVALCDRIAAAFPWAPTKCIADSGFFIDSKDREGGNTWRASAQMLVDFHKPNWTDCMDALPDTDHWKCFFPQYILQNVTTPIFLFHAFFDFTASTLGGLLPRNSTYAYACLHEVSWSSTGIIARKEWSRVMWRTNYCTAGEMDALFVAASVLYDELARITGSKNTVAAFVQAGMAHVALCYNTWTKATIRGMSVESELVRWFANKMSNRFVHT